MTNPNDKAFTHQLYDGEGNPISGGLTKREYFAAEAIKTVGNADSTCKEIASLAVQVADALIAELNKEVK